MEGIVENSEKEARESKSEDDYDTIVIKNTFFIFSPQLSQGNDNRESAISVNSDNDMNLERKLSEAKKSASASVISDFHIHPEKGRNRYANSTRLVDA